MGFFGKEEADNKALRAAIKARQECLDKLDTLCKEKEEAVKRLENQMIVSENRIEARKAEYSSMLEEYGSRSKALQELRDLTGKAIDEHSELLREVTLKKNEIDELDETIQNKKKEVASKDEHLSLLEATLHQKAREANQLGNIVNHLEKESKRLDGENDLQDKKAQELSQVIGTHQNRIQSLKEEINELEAGIADQKKALDQEVQHTKNQRQQTNKLKEEAEELQKQNTESLTAIEEGKRSLEVAEERLKMKIDKINERIRIAKAEKLISEGFEL